MSGPNPTVRSPSIATRRAPIALLTAAVAIGLPLAGADQDQPAADTERSRVVVVRDESAVRGFETDPETVGRMVAHGIQRLTGRSDEQSAWRQLVCSNDVVGIKINTHAAPLQSSRRPVVDAIVRGLTGAGLPAANIIVWDRDAHRMAAANFAPPDHAAGFRAVAVAPDGWDAEVFYENRLVGKLIWGDLLFRREAEDLNTRSHLPRVLTREITRLINVPVLQDHEACGIAGCLYNVSIGAVDNARRFELFGQRGDPAIAEIVSLPAIRDKLILNVMDALVAGYAGGPGFKPQFSWPHGALYFSQDPVAIDSLGLELLEARRRAANVPAIGERANHVRSAAAAGLGRDRPEQIELIETAP
jgi:uncharacterized protein (DUF362 family)